MLSLKNKKSYSQAEIVDSHLVLSLLDAQEPKVWRMELDKIGTASFEIKQSQNEDETKLILKPKKGTAEIIATYDTKEAALNALSMASQALQNQTCARKISKSAPANTNSAEVSENQKRWVGVLVGAFVVIGLYMYLSSLMPKENLGFGNTSVSTNSTAPVQERTGVPVSADEFLGGF